MTDLLADTLFLHVLPCQHDQSTMRLMDHVLTSRLYDSQYFCESYFVEFKSTYTHAQTPAYAYTHTYTDTHTDTVTQIAD